MKWLVVLTCLTTIALAANFKASLNRHTLDRKTFTLRTSVQKQMSPKFGHRLNKGSAPVTTYMDTFYVINVGIGAPLQEFQLLLDTGSADLWVVGRNCTDPQCDGLSNPNLQFWQKRKYHDELSSTFESNGTSIANGFSAFPYLGILEQDSVQIAGITVEKQLFTSTYDIGEDYGYFPIDGIFGLAWKTLALNYATPPFFNMIPQLDEPIFTIWLDSHVTTEQAVAGGQITFGAFDTQNCDSSNIVYAPLTIKSYWQFNLESVAFGNYEKRSTWSAIVDTGTSFLYGPVDQVNNILRIANADYDSDQDTYVVDCDADLPDVVFTINGNDFPVQSTEFVMDFGFSNNKCALAINGMYSTIDWLLAEPFLRQYCTVHDAGNAQVGFAKNLS